MDEFLYYFGYEDIVDREVNERFDSDDQSAILLKIQAESVEKAVEWGDEVAEAFIKFHYKSQDFSWKARGYSSGIETNIDEYLNQHWNKIPKIKYGDYPNFDSLTEPYD